MTFIAHFVAMCFFQHKYRNLNVERPNSSHHH